jgi:hypothetical protein
VSFTGGWQTRLHQIIECGIRTLRTVVADENLHSSHLVLSSSTLRKKTGYDPK